MRYQFDTDDELKARAALLLYAVYRSRSSNSPVSGMDTWTRFAAYMRGASIKSSSTAGFIQELCRKCKTENIKPRYLDTGDPVINRESGELIEAEGYYDYRMSSFNDDNLLRIFREESQYLILLVRERLQREKMEGETDEDND